MFKLEKAQDEMFLQLHHVFKWQKPLSLLTLLSVFLGGIIKIVEIIAKWD